MDFSTLDGESAFIEIRTGTDNWGPFSVDFTDALPVGVAVEQVTIAAYSGNVDASTDLAGATDITSLTVETTYSPLVDNVYGFKLQHPGSSYRGTTGTLVFTVKTDYDGTYPFFFYPVKFF
jgi:hypothetical protein